MSYIYPMSHANSSIVDKYTHKSDFSFIGGPLLITRELAVVWIDEGIGKETASASLNISCKSNKTFGL